MQADDTSGEAIDFLVRRDDWQRCEVRRAPVPATLASGQVLLRVDRFAFTTNNITYAVIGDMLGYWRFFPAESPWGRLPVMGFADVQRSAHSEVLVGERVFGFFPMATHLVIDAGEVTPTQFTDAAAHRQDTALPYRQYLRAARDPQYDAGREDQLMLLRGLFVTAFLVDDYLADQADFGATTFLISSASSKTAIALAFLLSGRGAGRVVGLTSPGNVAFVRRLGFYTDVLAYDQVADLQAADLPYATPVAFIDHAGDGALVEALHRHFGEQMKYSGIVGVTHRDQRPRAAALPGAEPAFFFAPAQMEKRLAEWGADGLHARLGGAWQRFAAASDAWLEVVRGYGPAAVEATYREVLEGRARPHQGHVLSLWPTAAAAA